MTADGGADRCRRRAGARSDDRCRTIFVFPANAQVPLGRPGRPHLPSLFVTTGRHPFSRDLSGAVVSPRTTRSRIAPEWLAFHPRNVLHPAPCRSVLPSSVANVRQTFPIRGLLRASRPDGARLRDRQRHPAPRKSGQSHAARPPDTPATPCGMARCRRRDCLCGDPRQGIDPEKRQAWADFVRRLALALGDMQRKGKVEKIGRGRAMRWRLIP